MSLLKDQDHEKRRLQVCFRVGEKAWERLVLAARLFEMREGEYCKAVVYRDLGVYDERIDRRRKPWRRREEREERK